MLHVKFRNKIKTTKKREKSKQNKDVVQFVKKWNETGKAICVEWEINVGPQKSLSGKSEEKDDQVSKRPGG